MTRRLNSGVIRVRKVEINIPESFGECHAKECELGIDVEKLSGLKGLQKLIEKNFTVSERQFITQ